MHSQTEKYQKSLSTIAQLYAGLGYSVIPIYGDTHPQKAKIATLSWKPYQRRHASDEQISQWFEQDNYGGVAIVTGRISNLIVLDFDSSQVQYEFEKRFPDLLDTRIVTSANRGLSHYYYAIPPYINIASKHINGVDLLSNGCYVIAPPTQINANDYTIKQGGMPHQLNQHQAQRLEQFFADNLQHPSGGCSPQSNDSVEIEHKFQSIKSITLESLIHLYQHYAPQIGRNNALFKVACHARDHQMTEVEVAEVLQQIHAQQPTYRLHRPEKEVNRLQEANRTIKSAFRYPPRQPKEQLPTQLTNSIREALLKRNLTCVARVLDGLFLKGFQPGDVITKKVVFDTLKGQVGKHSILSAFATHFDDGQPIFAQVSLPPRTPIHTTVANGIAKTTQNQCSLFTPSQSDKIAVGRIPTTFCIPDLNALCNMLGVPFTRSDPLTLDDIRQAKTYRQAVHRELIKRRPGMYHRWWLAKRIGVSKRTSQRYDNETVVQRKPMYIRQTVTWKKLDTIPDDEPIGGMFLEDEQGKRYPGLRVIAIRLLSQKQWVRYCYQDKNYYWVGDIDHPPLIKVSYGINPRQEEVDTQRQQIDRYLKQYWKDLRAKKHVKSHKKSKTDKLTAPSSDRKQIISVPEAPPMSSLSRYKITLSEERADYLSKCLYRAVWDKAESEKSRLSKANARQLVDTYGEKLIKRVLGVLKHRSNVNNPAGFVVVWLRSTLREMVRGA